MICCIISISLEYGLGILTLNWSVLGTSHCVMLLIHVSFQKQAALRYSGVLLQEWFYPRTPVLENKCVCVALGHYSKSILAQERKYRGG
jgi:hypothetical protein